MLSSQQPDISLPRANREAPPQVREQFLPRASAKDLMVYFDQMRMLLNAGFNLVAALDEMARSAPNQSLRHASAQMKQQLNAGRSWSEAMRSYPALFSRMTVALIEAGEKSGSLMKICGELSAFAEQEYEVRRMYDQETWYSKVLLFVSTVIIPLPISFTLWGRHFSLGFAEQALIIGGIWLVWAGMNWGWPLLTRGNSRLMVDRLKLRVPFVRDIVRGFAVAKVSRVLALMYSAGVSLPTALRIAADGCGNLAFAQSLREIAPRLERGETLSSVLTSTGEFPDAALGVVRTGEQSGDLDKNLELSVRIVEMDAKTKLFQSTKAIALVLYLFIAFKVGLQIVQFWMSYYGV